MIILNRIQISGSTRLLYLNYFAGMYTNAWIHLLFLHVNEKKISYLLLCEYGVSWTISATIFF